MADHAPSARPGPVLTQEAFLADREHFFASFTHFAIAGTGFLIVLLVLMAVFLV